jgi:Na+-driven multidrug efflux pump
MKLDWAILGKVLRIGLPTGLQMVVLSLSELVILALVNQHGSQATAAYGAVTQIVNYVQFPALSIAITASILGAQAIGAGRIERIGSILRTGLMISLCLTGGLVVLSYVLSHWLLGLFLTEEATRSMAEHLLHIMLWSLLVFGFQAVIGGIMRASGTVMVPVGISIVCVVGVQLPSAYLLDARFGLPGCGWRFRWRTWGCWRCRRCTTNRCGSTRRLSGWCRYVGIRLTSGASRMLAIRHSGCEVE